MGLARGWTDVYEWWQSGNYVEFGDNPDGLYLVRVTADPDGRFVETREDDNVAYSYIRVTGDHVDLLERGYGASPWDPERRVIE